MQTTVPNQCRPAESYPATFLNPTLGAHNRAYPLPARELHTGFLSGLFVNFAFARLRVEHHQVFFKCQRLGRNFPSGVSAMLATGRKSGCHFRRTGSRIRPACGCAPQSTAACPREARVVDGIWRRRNIQQHFSSLLEKLDNRVAMRKRRSCQ